MSEVDLFLNEGRQSQHLQIHSLVLLQHSILSPNDQISSQLSVTVLKLICSIHYGDLGGTASGSVTNQGVYCNDAFPAVGLKVPDF